MADRIWRFVGISFDHMHMGDHLRLIHEHPNAEIVGVCDPQRERMAEVARTFAIPERAQFTDLRRCLEEAQPEVAILCPRTALHAGYVEEVAPYGVHMFVEKPMAANVADADRMIRAAAATGKMLAINWPLAWYPPHLTAKRLIEEGRIGEVREVHYYDGNRGPLRHTSGKVEISEGEAARLKSQAWWYRREEGGGSLQDYLGYGATLGTWFLEGRAPLEVTCVVDEQPGLEVDEHSVTVARYASGLSTFQTRWGTFTDPWTHQPQPKCGFVLVGTEGTLSSYDYEGSVRIQTRDHPEGRDIPVDDIQPPRQNPIQYLLHCLEAGSPVEGPLSPALSRTGQQIVDAAALSAREKRAVRLAETA